MICKNCILDRVFPKGYSDFPDTVKREIGFALYQAQIGSKYINAKPLKGFNGSGVLEIVSAYDSDTYRGVYTVRFNESIYVLHTFKKKSKYGIKTPQKEIDLIEQRLRMAQEHYAYSKGS